MICNECQTKNITKAQFCSHCGNAFTDVERQQAYDKTIFGILDKLEEWKGYATLEFITGHPIFKTAVLVLILLWGLWLGRTNGNDMIILEGDTYRVQQNTENGDFYILTEDNQIPLNLYLPQQAQALQLQMVENDAVIYETSFTVEDEIHLDSTDQAHYLITANYGSYSEQITIYVILE